MSLGEEQGVTVRPATLDDVAEMSRVFVDTFHAAHRGQIPEALVLERTYETSAAGWRRTLEEHAASDRPRECVLVAADRAGRIVGLAMGGPARPWPADDSIQARRPTGECYLLYVDVARQHGGVGRALLTGVATFLGSHGQRRMLVAVLAVNEPARMFYESVGGVLLGERDFYDSGVRLDEVVYVWEDVTCLLSC